MTELTDHEAAIAVEIDYTNWRGERSKRVILPSGMVFDSSEYHPQPQWLVRAWDPDKQSYRDFAMDSIHAWTPLSRLALNRSGEQP